MTHLQMQTCACTFLGRAWKWQAVHREEELKSKHEKGEGAIRMHRWHLLRD